MAPHETMTGVGVLLMGAFTLGAAVFEWGFFWRNSKARFLEGLIGRVGARIFYGAIGALLALAGVGYLTGY